MKKKMIWVSAIVESLIVGLVTYNFISKGYSIRNLLGFPFSNIILGLGKLSASGKVGNGFAVMLWLLISSIPALVAIFFPKGKLSSIVRLLLFALSFITLDRLLALANRTFVCYNKNVVKNIVWKEGVL